MKDNLLKGKISVGRVNSSYEEDYIFIEVIDASSSSTFLRVKLSLEQFGSVIAGRSHVDCEFFLAKDAPVGKKLETKTEILSRPVCNFNNEIDRRSTAESAVKYLEIDGWKARATDVWNHRNWIDGDKVKVNFYRFVD